MADDLNPYQSPPDDSYLQAISPQVDVIGTQGSTIFFQSGHTRAVWAVRFLWLIVGLKVLAIAAVSFEIHLISDVRPDSNWMAKAEISDMCHNVLLGLTVLAFFISAISFLMWFHRVTKNLASLGAISTKYSPGWAVGYWFIPILNLFRPYQVMVEVWHGSVPQPERTASLVRVHRGSHAQVGWWWAAWIIMSVLNRGVTNLSKFAEDIETMIFADSMIIVAAVMSIPAALLAIALVVKIDRNQELRHQNLLNMNADVQQQPWMPEP